MAWFKGNNPVGAYTDEWGRIMCEILYATNEREAALGMSKTSWGDGAIGADPGVDALDGRAISVTDDAYVDARALIVEWKYAILGILEKSTWPHFVHKVTYDAMTPGELYTASGANYSGGFEDFWATAPYNDATSDTSVISTLLKMTEYLTWMRMQVDWDAFLDESRKKYWYGEADTRAEARALCDADTPEAAGPWGYSERSSWLNVYWRYWIYQGWWEYSTFVPSGASPKMVGLILKTEADWHNSAADFRIYKVTAAQYAEKNWGAEGDLVLSDTIPATPNTKVEYQFDDYSWLTTGWNTWYLKMIGPDSTPFAEDEMNRFAWPLYDEYKLWHVYKKSDWTYN